MKCITSKEKKRFMMELLTWSQCPSLSCVTRMPFGFASSVLRNRKEDRVRENERQTTKGSNNASDVLHFVAPGTVECKSL